MPLTADEEVIAAEITQEALSKIQAVTLTDEQVAWLEPDLTLWELKRDSVSVQLTGEVDYKTQRLLDAIRQRVRKMFGFPLYSDESGMGSTGSFAIPNVPVF